MTSSQQTSFQTKTRLLFITAVSAAFTAIAEAGLITSRGDAFTPAIDLTWGACIGALLTLGSLLSIAAIFLETLCRFIPVDRTSAVLQTPMSAGMNIIKGADAATLDSFNRRLRFLIALCFFTVCVAAISVGANSVFHEPYRISILVGVGAAVVALPLRYALSALLSLLQRKSAFTTKTLQSLARLTLISLISVTAGMVIFLLSFRQDIFGARDPYPITLTLLFAGVLFAAAPIARRFTPTKRRARLLLCVGPATLFIGIALAAVSDGGRSEMDTRGALSRISFRAVHRLLDMDGDGAPWLIGSDCHPFDPNISPFAEEIPNNGIDENCDGKDTAIVNDYFDPLEQLPPFPDDRRVENGNVLLIISDATAAKHLRMYGSDRNTMPNLERFAKKGTIFENSFSAANHTSIAMPSLLTGRYPSTFPLVQSRGWNSFGIPKWSKPLQLRMAKAGRDTFMLAGHNLYGFIRHFKHVENGKGKRLNAQQLGKMAMKQLKAIGPAPIQPVFAAIHFIDPHHPYHAGTNANKYGRTPWDRYDRELNYVDEALKPILKLMSTKAYRNWLVVITADHGEAFFEHGHPHHGQGLYDEEVRVPLVMRVPGVRASRVAPAVSHVDIVPTLLDWCGLKRDKTLPGHSLLPLAAIGAEAAVNDDRRVVFSEFFRTGDVFAAFDGRYSMIYTTETNRFALFDHKTDPHQKANIFKKREMPLLTELLKKQIRESKKRLAEGKRERP